MSFISSLNAALSGRGIQASGFCNTSDATEKRILMEYGAVFLADRKVSIPSRFMFSGESEVTKFQSSVKSSKKTIGGVTIELQKAAMDALLKVADEVEKKNLTLKPRGGKTAARRVFADTVEFWNNRVKDGINFWKANTNSKGKKLTEAEGKTLASLSGLAQLKEVLRLEAEGFFFSRDKQKTILASVAAPGTSQHLFMLAVDIEEFGNAQVRKIMAENQWFQTAFSDQPHFTFLGLSESVLPSLGLKSRTFGGQIFWTPKP